ncbi:MAG: hypothetical protein WCT33_05295 [Patescibacteria group bacterium]|jgi:hypothetical protein
MLKVPQPYFEGAPTTAAERRVLQNAGYVHITGLWFLTCSQGRGTHGNFVGGNLTPKELGTWHDFAGQSVIITERGEVWMKTGSAVPSAVAQLCPNGQSDYDPFNSSISRDDMPVAGMIRRIADPNDGLTYVP